MSQDGFDFRPPPARREARRFEVPPWEREQFERRAREQAERERTQREAEATAEAKVKTPPPEAGVAGPESAPKAAEVPKVQVDDKQVALMMLELRAEEPATLTKAWMVVLGAGIVVGLTGLAIGIWGVTALVRVGRAGALGGMVLVIFGLAFAGIGGWLIYKVLRQRGVL